MTSGVLVVDTQGRVTLANKEAAMILGKTSAELVGIPTRDHPEFQSLCRLIARVQESRPLHQRSSEQYEICLKNFEGREIPLGVSINALLEGDTVLGYVAICKDLTERKALEASVERSERLSSLGTMASGVAHNFNNILAAILGRVQLMLRYPGKMDTTKGLEMIQKAALDGAATVKRIQDFARVRVSEGDFEAVRVDDVVQETLEYARDRAANQLATHPTIEVFAEIDCGARIAGLANELSEVLVNLVNNAFDAMGDGGILTLRSSFREGRVRIQVQDTGEGMSETVRSRIFDPFFSTKGTRGMGLGLAESYGIIRRHRGKIEVQSELGVGTTFVLDFPEGTFSDVEDGSEATQTTKSRTGRILVVDDEAEQAEMLAEMLSGLGHEVEVRVSGESAWMALQSDSFDVLVSDISMPDIQGWELARRCKKLYPKTQVLFVTGLGDAFSEEELSKAGVRQCLAKPILFEDLIAGIHSALEVAS